MRTRQGARADLLVTRRRSQKLDKMLVDTREDQSDENLATLAHELSRGFERYDPLEGILESLCSSLIPTAPLNTGDFGAVGTCHRAGYALQQFGLIILALDEAPESAPLRKYTARAYRMILQQWENITRWMLYLILFGPKVDPGGKGGAVDTTQALRMVASHAHGNAYKEELISRRSTVDLVFLLLRQTDEATGDFWDLESDPSEEQGIVASLLTLYCQSEVGRNTFNGRQVPGGSGAENFRKCGGEEHLWSAPTAGCIIDAAVKLASDPCTYQFLEHYDFLGVYAWSLFQLSGKALHIQVPTGDKGFWYKLACAAQRVIMMAAAYAPNTSKRVANLIQAGLLTCSLRCLPHAGANPDPVVEGLRSFLPYLYTSRALFAIERAPELQSFWSEPPPLLFGGSQEVWPAYMAAITRDREAYVLRGDRSTPMCSNLQCPRDMPESHLRERDWRSFHSQECSSLSAEYTIATNNGTWCSYNMRRDYARILDSLANDELPPPAEEMSLDGIPADHVPKPRVSRRDSTLWRWSALHTKTFKMKKTTATLTTSDSVIFGPWKRRVGKMILDVQANPDIVLAQVLFLFDFTHIASTFATLRYSPESPEGERYTVLNSAFQIDTRRATIQLNPT